MQARGHLAPVSDLSDIRVGITEWHGAIDEAGRFPPAGVTYTTVTAQDRSKFWPVRSPIKGYLRKIASDEHDLIEAIISPINTSSRWVYSLAHYAEALAFSLWNLPTPRAVRSAYVKSLLRRDNCRQIVFWSDAGLRTFEGYGSVSERDLLNKTTVVYPAVRDVPEELIAPHADRTGKELRILFSGDFFIKGGANVIDAFERVQKRYPLIQLRLCCDESRDFNTTDERLREIYLRRIKNNSAIQLGRVSRDEMLAKILPTTDIYLLPTYADAFGFALLEAMAYGIPIVATNYFAIPEIVADGMNGYLIDVQRFDCAQMFRGCFVRSIPEEFHSYMTEQLSDRLSSLIESDRLRRSMGSAGLELARTKFSFATHNKRMRAIYESALA